MTVPRTYGDSYVLLVEANLMGFDDRDILIIPTKGVKSANNPYGYLLIDSFVSNCDPIFMLYFEEHVYGIGHYQSIRSVTYNLNLLGGGGDCYYILGMGMPTHVFSICHWWGDLGGGDKLVIRVLLNILF